MSVINKLGDNCVVLAVRALNEIADAFNVELKRKPTIAELCEILTWGARGSNRQLVADGANRGLTIIGRAEQKPATSLSKGALISVPHSKGRHAVLVYLGAFGRFGKAFGIVDELVSPDQSLDTWTPSGVLTHPIFADDEYIQTGRWSNNASRSEMVSKFRQPELYQDPQNDPGDGSYGPHGLAEELSGKTRMLAREEAAEIFGAVPGGFRVSITGDQLETYLRKLLPRSSKGHRDSTRTARTKQRTRKRERKREA